MSRGSIWVSLYILTFVSFTLVCVRERQVVEIMHTNIIMVINCLYSVWQQICWLCRGGNSWWQTELLQVLLVKLAACWWSEGAGHRSKTVQVRKQGVQHSQVSAQPLVLQTWCGDVSGTLLCWADPVQTACKQETCLCPRKHIYKSMRLINTS